MNDIDRMLRGVTCAACGVLRSPAGRGRLVIGTRPLRLCHACSADLPAAARKARSRAVVARDLAARLSDVAEALESADVEGGA